MIRHIQLHSGRNLACWDQGDGDPLLFVHGFPLDHSMWHHQLLHFASQYRCLAPDLCGFGLSTAQPGTVTMADFADDLVQLLRALQIEVPVTLCGLSMGGYIAWPFWMYHRDWLSRLILCDTKAGADPPEVARGRQLMAAEVLAQGAGLAADRLLPKLFASNTPADHIEPMAQVIRRTNPVGIAAAQQGMAVRPDMTPRLADIDLPTLVLVGEFDVITPAVDMEAMARSMPNAKFHVIPGAGHMSPWEQPAEVNRIMQEFLASGA